MRHSQIQGYSHVSHRDLAPPMPTQFWQEYRIKSPKSQDGAPRGKPDTYSEGRLDMHFSVDHSETMARARLEERLFPLELSANTRRTPRPHRRRK